MFCDFLFTFFFVTFVQAQLNGEFWWLNNKITNLKKVKPSLPEIDASDFQNDESARIIFRDDDSFTRKVLKPIKDRTSKLIVTESSDPNKIVWPMDDFMKSHDVEVFTNKNSVDNGEESRPSKIQNKFEDVLVFSYPKNDKFVTVKLNKATTESIEPTFTQNDIVEIEEDSSSAQILLNADILSTSTSKDKSSQNICTYTNIKKCHKLNGFVYEYARRVPKTSNGEVLVCCVLPIQPILDNDNLSETVHFTRSNKMERFKRSNVEQDVALNQRDFLLKRKFPGPTSEKPAATPFTKIVTPPENDYVDPYWNIKNTRFQITNKPKLESTKYDYYSEDYAQVYADELPKPGLYGLYSDHAKSPSSWSFVGNKGFSYGGPDVDYEDDEIDSDENFGYSTIDPRQGSKKQKVKPIKQATESNEATYNAESHTINFQSNPDFHVFQGFKLLNLFRNTSRVYNKNIKGKTNRDSNIGVLVGDPDESEETETFNDNQLFSSCGRTVTQRGNEKGTQIGEAANGSHPWMVLVVLTKRKHNILCYATLVHPRAAVTVADCVDGTAQGDVTVIAGLWDMAERSRAKSRVVTVHVHPKYKPGDVDNNLAVLHWMRPLQLTVNIQPACLGEPQIGEECKFFGWGALNKGIQQQRSQWQHVTIRACTQQYIRSTEAFCVTTPRGTVTGMGGPLICDVAGRSSIVGTIVSRDSGYVLLTVRDWVIKAENLVSGD